MSILRGYLGQAILKAIVRVLFVVAGIEFFFELVNQLSVSPHPVGGVMTSLLCVLLKLPGDVYALFPMVGFLGALVGFGRMAECNELVVMQALGASILQVVMLVMQTALLITLVATAVGEGIAPVLDHYAQQLQGPVHHQKAKPDAGWLSGPNGFVYVGRVVSSSEVADVTGFVLATKTRQLASVWHATSGQRRAGRWVMLDVKKTNIQASHTTTSRLAQMSLKMDFQTSIFKRPATLETVSVVSLLRKIQELHDVGLVSTEYAYRLWRRIIQPVTTVLMICLGVPFVFGALRSISVLKRIVFGVVMGFSFYMVDQFFGPLTLIYQWQPWLAAMLPTIAFVMVCAILLRRIR